MKNKSPRGTWGQVLVVIGSIGLLVGALDPLEGSVVILTGSALILLGSWLGHVEKRLLQYRTTAFLLIAFGVGAMFVLSNMGGFGGRSGLSMWWGALILPYLAGWVMGLLGSGNPRWMFWAGIADGLWYMNLCRIVLSRPAREETYVLSALLGMLGVMVTAGCVLQLMRTRR
jgi:hypothetical protein